MEPTHDDRQSRSAIHDNDRSVTPTTALAAFPEIRTPRFPNLEVSSVEDLSPLTPNNLKTIMTTTTTTVEVTDESTADPSGANDQTIATETPSTNITTQPPSETERPVQTQANDARASNTIIVEVEEPAPDSCLEAPSPATDTNDGQDDSTQAPPDSVHDADAAPEPNMCELPPAAVLDDTPPETVNMANQIALQDPVFTPNDSVDTDADSLGLLRLTAIPKFSPRSELPPLVRLKPGTGELVEEIIPPYHVVIAPLATGSNKRPIDPRLEEQRIGRRFDESNTLRR